MAVAVRIPIACAEIQEERALKWVLQDTRSKKKNRKGEVRILDVFSGCGGLSLGAALAFEDLGFEPVIAAAIEADPAASAVYKENFSGQLETMRQVDVRSIVSNRLEGRLRSSEIYFKRDVGRIDVVVSGPPCQGHSDLNNHTRRSDPRNSLYLNAIRFVKLVQPRLAIIENVANVLHSREQVVAHACGELIKLGYHVESAVHNAVEYSVPQWRRRHVLIATKYDHQVMKGQDATRPCKMWPFIEDLEDEPEFSESVFRTPSSMTPTNGRRAQYLLTRGLYDLPDKLRPACHRERAHTYRSCYGRLHHDEPSPTLTSGFGSMGQGRFLHPTRARTLTPHEVSRLQTFPEFFRFDGIARRTALATMLGNAVPPLMAYALIRSAAESNW